MSGGVDLAREERMQIRDQLLDQFRMVFKGKTLNKYKEKESSLKKDFV